MDLEVLSTTANHSNVPRGEACIKYGTLGILDGVYLTVTPLASNTNRGVVTTKLASTYPLV
jgi:hypothetical protein